MKKNTLAYSLLCLTVLISGCNYNVDSSPKTWLEGHGLPMPSFAKSMTLCQNFGCNKSKKVTLSIDEVNRVHQFFSPLPESAEEERTLIKNSIGLLEAITGPKLGTDNDLPENSFHMRSNQLDCIAETSNTSNYLLFLQSQGLIKYHRIGGNLHRGLFSFNAPHNSAAIIERSTNKAYAVDAWFRANGEPAWITGADHWLSGARP